MKAKRDAEFRLELAEGFLKEAEQDLGLARWRSCADNAQMSVENAAKAVIAMHGPVPKVHQVKPALARLSQDPGLKELTREIAALEDISEKLGFEAHIRSDYGDESQYRTPWELFDRSTAEEALTLARKARDYASTIVQRWPPRKKD